MIKYACSIPPESFYGIFAGSAEGREYIGMTDFVIDPTGKN